jgi:EAL domain-containing protein (putative c-di-GMP-specific phosphodiesterase class I)
MILTQDPRPHIMCSMNVNLTLAVDDQILRRARTVAEAMGKSLNQVVREYLEGLAATDDAEAEIAELRALSEAAGGSRRGWVFDRDALHART